MRKSLLFILLCLTCGVTAEAQSGAIRGASEHSHRQTKAPNVTGTYSNRTSEFKILDQGGGQLKIQFDGSFPYRVGKELMANTGTASGTATLNGNVAVFVPEGFESCKITLRFAGRSLKVTQEGTDSDCGFGNRVMATGTYTRRSSRPPKFETEP